MLRAIGVSQTHRMVLAEALLLTAVIPARHASRMDVIAALRCE